MITGFRFLKVGALMLVLAFVMSPSAEAAGRRRVARLAYSSDRPLARRYLRFNPFAVRRRAARYLRSDSLALRRRSTDEPVESLEVSAAPETAETLSLRDSGGGTANATGGGGALGVRPPIRVPFRPPLRSPYRPPVPW